MDDPQKYYAKLKKKNKYKRPHVIWFHLYEYLEKAIHKDKADKELPEGGSGDWRQMRQEGTFWVVMAAQLYV